MPLAPIVTVVIDRLGYAYCVPCATARQVVADGVYHADNAAAEAVECDGCGRSDLYRPGAAGLAPRGTP